MIQVKGVREMKRILLAGIIVMVFSVFVSGLIVSAQESAVYLTVAQEGKIITPVYSLLSFRTIVRGLDGANGLVCSPEGNLYVVETWKSKIISYSQSGDFNDTILEENELKDTVILHLALHDGDLYFTTSEEGIWRIEGADPENEPRQLISPKYFKSDEQPYGLAFLTEGEYSGDLVVSLFSENEGRLVRLPAPDFGQLKEFAKTYKSSEDGPVKTKQLKSPSSVAVGPEGNVFVGDWALGGGILKYGPQGNFLEVFTEDIVRPNGLTIGPDNILYTTTAAFGRKAKGSLRRYKLDGSQKRIITRPGAWAVTVCEN